jgi:hypothetical protein
VPRVNASLGPTFVVVDLDGVLADTRHRQHWLDGRPKQWSQFFASAVDDAVLPEGRTAVELAAQAHEIVYLTGRPANYRRETTAWLAQHALPAGELVMRTARDHRPARLMKLEELGRLQRRGEIVMVIDDDEEVVRAVEQVGIPVTHAQWMPEPERQARTRTAPEKTPGT